MPRPHPHPISQFHRKGTSVREMAALVCIALQQLSAAQDVCVSWGGTFAKCPSARYFLASARVTMSNHCWLGLLKLMATFGTAVAMRSRSALIFTWNKKRQIT